MKKLYILFLIIIIIFNINCLSQAQINLTPRALGMGGAFTAVADDLTTFIYNTAGISQVGFLGAYTSAGIRTKGIDEFPNIYKHLEEALSAEKKDEIIASIPENVFINGHIFAGANIGNFAVGLNVYGDVQNIKEDNCNLIYNNLTSEGFLGFGEKINSSILNLKEVSYGVKYKVIHSENNLIFFNNEDEEQDIKVDKIRASSFSLDTGVLVKVNDILQFGLQIDNLFAPEFVIRDESNSPIEYIDEIYNVEIHDPARTLRLGMSLYVPLLDITFVSDISNIPLGSANDNLNTFTHFGAEKKLLLNTLSLRGGTYNIFKGDKEDRIYTMGLSLDLLGLKVDTAIGISEDMREEQMLVFSGNLKF